MTTLTGPNRSAAELAESLTRIAAHQGMTRHLHEILGAFCHQSRNVLNCLKMSLYLIRRGTAPEEQAIWDEVESNYQVIESLLDRLQLICRPMTIAAVRLPLSLLFDDRKSAWEESLAARGRRLIFAPAGEPAVGAFDPQRFGQGFDGLVSWRVREGEAGSPLRVTWGVERDGFCVVWDEPGGQGVSLEPPASAGNDLTVALLTRIVTLHGGSLRMAHRPRWSLEMRWPLDARPHMEEAPRC